MAEKKALIEYLMPRLTKTSASVSLFSPIIVKATQGSSTSLYSIISVLSGEFSDTIYSVATSLKTSLILNSTLVLNFPFNPP